MTILKNVLNLLSGKKTIISGLIMTTVAYIATVGIIDAETAVYINAMTTLLFGSASIATGKIIYNK